MRRESTISSKAEGSGINFLGHRHDIERKAFIQRFIAFTVAVSGFP